MKALHVSDTHGQFIPLEGEFDIIVHSGDLLINFSPQRKQLEAQRQEDWVIQNIEFFKTWIKDKPFFFCQGNHDFFDPCNTLKQHGINAISITNKVIEHENIKFYGFPYVNYLGFWNNELTERAMNLAIENLISICNQEFIDILVAHNPPYKMLDRTHQKEYIGNRPLAIAIKNELFTHPPKFILSGHCHENNGIYTHLLSKSRSIVISNAATTQRIISL